MLEDGTRWERLGGLSAQHIRRLPSVTTLRTSLGYAQEPRPTNALAPLSIQTAKKPESQLNPGALHFTEYGYSNRR